MKERYTLPSILMQISLGGIFCALSYILISGGQPPACYFPGGLLVFGPLVYGANWLFLSRDRTVISLVALNVVLALLMIGSVGLVCGFSPCGGLIPVGIFTILMTLRGAQLNLKPPRLSSAILWMEGSIVTLAIFIGVWFTLDSSMIWSLPVAIGGGASLLAVIVHRMDQILGLREWLLLLLLFALMGGILWLLVAFLAVPTGQGVVAIWGGLMALLKLIGGGIRRFMLFLSSFIEPESYEMLELEAGQGMEMNFSESDSINPMLGIILAGILVVLIVAAAIAAVVLLGRQRLGWQKISVGKKRAGKRTRPSLLAALKRFLAEILSRIRFRRLLWKRRNTVTGTYYYLERICRQTPWEKQAGETPREFLTRLQVACVREQICADGLGTLALLVEQALYSARSIPESFAQAKLLRTAIRKMARTSSRKRSSERFERRT